MIKLIEKHPYLSILLTTIIMLGFTIDSLPVSIMEARNFISAREMLTDNNWILTTMNGEPRYQKPPLPTWITAIFGYLFGIKSVLALRWPALLMVAVTGIFGYKICKKITENNKISTIAGLILITSFYIIGITIEGPWDIYTHGFMLAAIYQLIVMLLNKKITLIQSLLFIFFLGCSILSKGPVSIYVLFLSFSIAFGFSFGYKNRTINYVYLFIVLGLGIALGSLWFIYVRLADPETFINITNRETSNWTNYNVRPFYYYWSFFVQSGLWTIPAFISLLYPYLRTRVKHKKAYFFSFLWTIIAVVLLSVIPEKKSRYLMPVLIPLALNISFYIDYLIKEFKSLKSKKETIPVYFNFGLIGLIALFIPFSFILFYEDLEGVLLLRFILFSIVSFTLGVLILKYLKQKDVKKVFYTVIGFMVCVGFLGLPMAKLQKQKDYNPISKWERKGVPVYLYGKASPELLYNNGGKIPVIHTDKELEAIDTSEYFILSDDRNLVNKTMVSNLYKITYEDTFDMNTATKGKRGYKKRLVNHLFKLVWK